MPFGLSIFKKFPVAQNIMMVNGHFAHNTFYYIQVKEAEFVL